jgi:hypothetical protein
MNYNKFLFFLLFNLSLFGVLHAGMQDRAYYEVLIDNVTHPTGGNVTLNVGPDGRMYVSYSYLDIGGVISDGWVEVYSAEGVLLATIDRSYFSYSYNNNTYGPSRVMPGPGGIFTIYDSYRGRSTVFDSNFQEYRTTYNSIYNNGWTRSLDGGFVTVANDYEGSYIQIRDGTGSVVETTQLESTYLESLSLNGYALTYTTNGYWNEDTEYVPSRGKNITFDVDGVIQSRDDLFPITMGEENYKFIGFPTIVNNQVVVPRRAYRTKGDTNAIPVPSIVSVAQVPDTTLIDITYRVDDADDATVTTGILASMTDGQGNTTRIPLATLAGGTAANLGAAVATNIDLTVTWDAGVDWGAAFGDISFDVYANDGRPVLGFHMLTLPLPSGDLTISRSPVNDLEIKEALYYLWATGQGIRLDNGQLVGQGGLFEGVLLGTPEAPVTDTSRAMLFYQLGLQQATEAQVNAARQSFDADTVYTFTPKNPIQGDLLYGNSLPKSVNELGFNTNNYNNVSYYRSNSESWVVPATSFQAVVGGASASYTGGDISFTMLDPSNEGWSISNLPDWLSTTDPTSGVGHTGITLSATENANLLSRTSTIDLNDGAVSITLSQSGDSSIVPDNFADRIVLTGDSGSFTVSNANATFEPGEPPHADRNSENSLWFTFTAAQPGDLIINVNQAGSSVQPFITYYEGNELSTLSQSGWDYQYRYIDLDSGDTRQIAITTPTSSNSNYGSGSPGVLDVTYQFYPY